MYQHQKLRPRHYDILSMTFLGMKQLEIARELGITQQAVSCIVNSALAKNELARMTHDAREGTVAKAVDRASILSELNGAAAEAVRLNRTIMNDPHTDIKLKARLGMHFQDRVIFNQMETPDQTSYREILRSLTKIEEGMVKGIVVLPKENSTNGSSGEVV